MDEFMNYVEKIRSAFDYAISSNFKRYDVQINVRKRIKEAEKVVIFGIGEFFNDNYKARVIDFEYDYLCDNDSKKWGGCLILRNVYQ